MKNMKPDNRTNKHRVHGAGNISDAHSGRTVFQNDILNEILNEEDTIGPLSDEMPDKKSPILTMKNEWSTYSSIDVQQKILKHNTEIIIDFMNSLEVPSWYRGLSSFQRESANSLQNAIRDDCAQHTVYRTMRCLESIGLDPLPTKNQLRKLLPLSGFSDLALLWFLMEWLYRDNDSDSYSVNEQLILSSIAHLDMDATLRELDRILPPKQDKTKMSPGKNDLKNRTAKNKKPKKYFGLPYFEKLPQRRQIKCRSLNTDRNPSKISGIFPYQLNGTEAVSSSHRWFQSYSFEDNEKSAQNLAKEVMNRFSKNSEAATCDERQEHTKLRHHDEINNLKNSFDAQLDAIVKNKAQEVGQIFERKNQSYKRMISRFQTNIEQFRHEFYTMTENCHKLLTGNNHDHIQTEQRNMEQKCALDEEGKQCKGLSQKSSPTELCLKPSENSSESNFFSTCKNHQPFKFNYFKIYACEDDHPEIMNIHSDFVNQLQKQTPIKTCSSEEVDNDTSSCVHKIYQQALTQHEVMEFTNTAKVDSSVNVVDYGLDYYDPEDDELMDRMLEDALNIMKKDHKFVLASIPAAHRHRILREWIRLRYGKRNSIKELSKCWKQTKPIFKALSNVGLPVELPSSADMGKKLITDYSCRDYVIKKSNFIRNQFYNRLDKAMLAQSRVIYFAMRPFLFCKSKKNVSNTIFAYMPAHRREIYHFRPWKIGECMKRKQLSSHEVINRGAMPVKRRLHQRVQNESVG